MDESTPAAPHSPTPATPPARAPWRERRWIARGLIIAFALGGFWLFRPSVPLELAVVLALPPTLYAPGGGRPRADAEALDLRVLDAEGAEIARAHQRLGRLDGPLAPPLPLNLPTGRYLVEVDVVLAGGQRVRLRGPLAAEDSGPARVELR